MRTCPCCGHYMTFRMKYVAGQPVVTWHCFCGYDTSQECTYVTNNSTMKQREKFVGRQIYSGNCSDGVIAMIHNVAENAWQFS